MKQTSKKYFSSLSPLLFAFTIPAVLSSILHGWKYKIKTVVLKKKINFILDGLSIWTHLEWNFGENVALLSQSLSEEQKLIHQIENVSIKFRRLLYCLFF